MLVAVRALPHAALLAARAADGAAAQVLASAAVVYLGLDLADPIIGLVIMENAKKSGANKWAGTLYNRENGKSYSGSITIKSKDAVDLSGCVALVLCRAVTWTRIK